MLTFTEFIKREGSVDGLLKLEAEESKRLLKLASFCENRRKSKLVASHIILEKNEYLKIHVTSIAPMQVMLIAEKRLRQ